jgi:hypothetical protein
VVARTLAALAAILGGLLAGGMLLIRVALVPLWQRESPAEFRRWYGRYNDHIRGLMRPLGAASAAAATASAVAQATTRDGARLSSVTAATAALGVAAVTVLVNEPANDGFVQGEVSDEEIGPLLARWVRAHEVRVALGLVGTVAAVRAVSVSGRRSG